jgi:hypothetical protein
MDKMRTTRRRNERPKKRLEIGGATVPPALLRVLSLVKVDLNGPTMFLHI